MSDVVIRVPYEEFVNDPRELFNRVISENATIVVERNDGDAVVLISIRLQEAAKRNRTKADHEAFLASAGGWRDFDIDTFLKNLYESRNMPPRPSIEL